MSPIGISLGSTATDRNGTSGAHAASDEVVAPEGLQLRTAQVRRAALEQAEGSLERLAPRASHAMEDEQGFGLNEPYAAIKVTS